ncbi:MAG: rare lipoprotein [Proteobacteria bacterium]|jgi:rare lipoprotein A|nr:rare lipoprotein [Pseudomonadota bacterium]
MNFRFLLIVATALAAGCASVPRGGYYQDDGPHRRPEVDVSKVPDAVPRNEPYNERNNRPYSVFGVDYRPLKTAKGYRERGVASWYGKKFHKQRTANGETYDMYAMTAAHKTLPLPSYLRVRNLNNGKSVIVRVNDRGPFRENRIVDLSYAAAVKLGILGTGTGIVEIEALSGDEPVTQVAARAPEPEPLPKAATPRLYLQVGAFTSRDNAENLKLRLARADLKSVHIQNADLDATPLYRVRIGPLDSVDESDRLAARVAAQGLPNPIVVVEQ